MPLCNSWVFVFGSETVTCRYLCCVCTTSWIRPPGLCCCLCAVMVRRNCTSLIGLPCRFCYARSLVHAWEGHLLVQGSYSGLDLADGIHFSPITQSIACVVHKDRRKDSMFWRASQRLHLPPQDLDFIFTGLWKKLPIGKRLHAFFPWVPPTCRFEGAQEDVYHRLKVCLWLTIPVRILQCTFLAVFSQSGRAPISRLCTDYPVLSLTMAPSLLLWKVSCILWLYWCAVRMRSTGPDLHFYDSCIPGCPNG